MNYDEVLNQLQATLNMETMNRVPTLVLGIGGIGCRIASRLDSFLSEKDKEYVGIVGLDTNINDLKVIKKKGIKTIQTSEELLVKDYLDEDHHPEYQRWFPINKFVVNRGLINGAGQVRAISRLGALAAIESNKFVTIKQEITRIRAHKEDDSGNGNITVMVVGSVTGGTGAGLFIQLPFYVRNLLKDESGIDSVIIRGMFIGPDVTADVQPSKINRDAVKVNAYSCIKELNAFYLTQVTPDSENNLEVDFYNKEDGIEIREKAKKIRERGNAYGYEHDYDDDYGVIDAEDSAVVAGNSANIPYDYLYLIERNGSNGGVGLAELETIEDQVARIVHTLMFTPVANNALSVEDNMVLQDMDKGGMNRYSSAGLCRLVFPNAAAKEYVTMCSIRDLIKNEWLLLDRQHEENVKQCVERQQTDPSVVIPTIEKDYPMLFRRATGLDRGTPGIGAIGHLFNEAYHVNAENQYISNSETFITELENLVCDVVGREEIEEAKKKCSVNFAKMEDFDNAKKAVSDLFNDMDSYVKIARKTVTDNSATIANDMTPSSVDILRSKVEEESNSCIYKWLSGVHPVVARFLCYEIINKLAENIDEAKANLDGLSITSHETADLLPDVEGVQKKESAVEYLRVNRIPILGRLGKDKSNLQKLSKTLANVVSTFNSSIDTYMRSTIMLNTCEIMLKRVRLLADNYSFFFRTIEQEIENNNKSIDNILRDASGKHTGQINIYSSPKAFEQMYREYQTKVDGTLPSDTMNAIFINLYEIVASELSSNTSALSESEKANNTLIKKAKLNSIFQKAVVDTIRTNVIKNGTGIVDLNIIEALRKETEIEGVSKEMLNDKAMFEKMCNSHVTAKIKAALRNADPMLAADPANREDITESIYIAMNTSCGVVRNNDISVAATAELYLSEACEETDNLRPTFLLNNQFSPYEIACVKAKYKFLVQDLVKYRKGGDFERAYNERILSIGTEPVATGPDAYKTVVNPHLNRYWHEEGFVPPLTPGEREQSKRNVLRAFFYSMGYDVFVLSKTEDEKAITWFIDMRGGFRMVRKCGRVINKSYASLYDSLYFNGKIKRFLLSVANTRKKMEKSFHDPMEMMEILSDPLNSENVFIADLIQAPEWNDSNDVNILDIIWSMRSQMPRGKWLELFDGLLETIWDYCSYMLDNNEINVNKVTRIILDNILKYSEIGRSINASVVNGNVLGTAEQQLTAVWKNLRDTEYHA